MLIEFTQASLLYGATKVPVQKSADCPFQDFLYEPIWGTDELKANIEAQAFYAMSIMSHASGCHAMKNGVLTIWTNEHVQLTGNGFVVTWGSLAAPEPSSSPAVKLSFYEQLARRALTFRIPFCVIADIGANGWKRATKIAETQF